MSDQSIFSDFTSPITVRSESQFQSKGPHPSTSSPDEDEDWGDFILSPVPSHTQSPPPNTTSSPSHTLWEKPKGALPLSLFGEEDELEHGSAATHPPGTISRSVSLPNDSNGIAGSDGDEDEGWEFKGADSLNDNAAGLGVAQIGLLRSNSLSGLNSSWNAFSFDQIGSAAKSEDQIKSDTNGIGFDFYDGNEESGNGDDWGFVGAESVSQVGDTNSKAKRLDDEKGSKSNSLSGLNSSWNAFSFDQIGSAKSESQLKADTNGMGFDFYDGNEESGNGDDWGFVGGESVSQVGDANCKKVENHGQAGFSYGVNNSAHGPIGMTRTSDVTSHSQWGFGFDVNPINLTQDGLTSKSYSHVMPDHTQKGQDSSPAGRNIVTDKELWGFKDVGNPNDTASGHDSSLARKDNNIDEDFWDIKDAGKPDDDASGHDTSISRKDENTDEDFWDFKDAGKPYDSGKGHSASISGKDDNIDEDFWGFKNAGKPVRTANGHDAFLTTNKDDYDDNDKDIWDFKDAGKPDDGLNGHDSSLAKKDADTDEDVWEFKDAFSEMGSKHQEDQKSVFSPAVIQQVEYNDNTGHALSDTSVASNGTPYQYGEWNFGSTVESKKIPADQIVDSDETLWTVESTSPGNNVKQKEAPNVTDGSAHSRSTTSDTEIKQNEMKLEKKEALPLSFFSDQNLDADESSSHEENIMNSSATFIKTSSKSPSSNISINDLISNLYNEADKQSPVKSSDMVSKQSVAESNLANSGEDGYLEFEEAFCGNKAEDQTSGPGIVESYRTVSYRLELNECMELYCKLKDELCSVVLCHLDNLKKARSNGSLYCEDEEVANLDKEIEEFYSELRQDNLISEDLKSEEAIGNLQEVLGVLQEPKFQVLESELQLSKNISMAEKDLRSAIKLLRHVASTLRILKVGSSADRSNYVSTWFRVISVCAQELKRAAFIWKQSLQRNVHNKILSDVRGKRYILAIGEVYRVVALIQASVKLYKPWFLLSSADLSNMHAVISECSALWSSSGLEEALSSISGIEDREYEGTAEALLESINHIDRLDEVELLNYAFSEQEPYCRLSLLKEGVVPGLQLETWNGENYFVKLVNLWGNLVSCDSSELPRLKVG